MLKVSSKHLLLHQFMLTYRTLEQSTLNINYQKTEVAKSCYHIQMQQNRMSPAFMYISNVKLLLVNERHVTVDAL